MTTVKRKRITAAPRQHHLDKRAAAILAAEPNNNIPPDDDDLLTTIQVASWLGVSVQFLEIGRSRGYGPEFTALGPRCIRYTRGNVRKYLRARTHASTADYRGRKVEEVA